MISSFGSIDFTVSVALSRFTSHSWVLCLPEHGIAPS
ncbi:MAG: hypothetical protein RL318_3060, partial [Fibrobacterota bacterium]